MPFCHCGHQRAAVSLPQTRIFHILSGACGIVLQLVIQLSLVTVTGFIQHFQAIFFDISTGGEDLDWAQGELGEGGRARLQLASGEVKVGLEQ